jgi:O-antigen ligase
MVVLVLLGIAIFLTQTRGVWLALLFSLIVYYIKRPKIYLIIILFFGLFFVAFQDVIITRFLTIKNFGSDVSSLGRLQAWFASVVLIKDNIFAGYGFDSFMRLRDDVFYFYIVPVIHSHNTYLRSLLEMGLIGTTIYFTFLIKALFYTYKLKKQIGTNEYIGLIDGLQLSFLSLFIVFMFEPYFSLFGCSTIVIWFLISLSYKLKYQFYKNDNS